MHKNSTKIKSVNKRKGTVWEPRAHERSWNSRITDTQCLAFSPDCTVYIEFLVSICMVSYSDYAPLGLQAARMETIEYRFLCSLFRSL